ncbi:hypothetical protein IRT45_25900 [Nocardia sp. BSTN01]|uniref:hypothetical protein n=1 Tax=Nocardia sp. BSTN01 TaxID=2783665 RepID=UPI00188F9FFB|nr:hypothetical protein [Nocardia sp. BSTN01]MBF5000581.1 hypothetical protein [Nocardia sp. BSTN01]
MTMYQVSDLAGARRREFLDEAKQSLASLRDTDGSVLVMLAAQRMAALTEAAAVITQLFTVEGVLARTQTPTPVQLGGLAWLSEFDPDDRAEALDELRNAVVLTVTSEDPTPLRETLHAWVTTAAVMRDPLRRAVHTGGGNESDYVEVTEPQTSGDV